VKNASAGLQQPSPFLTRLSRFLDLTALFLLLLAVSVRPLFPGLAVSPDVNILTTALLLAAAALVALRAILLARWPLTVGWPLMLLGAYALFVMLLVPFAPYRYAAILKALDVFALFLLLFAAGALLRTVTRARFVFAALLATALTVALFGIYQRFILFRNLAENVQSYALELLQGGRISSDMVSAFQSRVASQEVFSTFMLSNSFAAYLLLLLPLVCAFVWNAWRRRSLMPLITTGLYLPLVVLVLFLTASKGAWLAFPLALALTFVLFWKTWPVLFRRIGLALLLAGFLLVVLFVALRPLPEAVRGSVDVRLGYWQGALQLIKTHPLFGVGPGNFRDAYTQVKTPEASEVQHPHNGYLEIAAETGLPALALVVVFWLLVLIRVRKTPVSSDALIGPPEKTVRLLIGAAGLLAFLFQAFLIHVPEFPEYLLLLFVLVWTALYTLLTTTDLFQTITERRTLSIALTAGLLVFLLHALIDIDMIVPGISWVALVLVACVCGLRPSPDADPATLEHPPARKPLCSGLLTTALFVVFVLWIFIIVPIGTGASHMAQAEIHRSKLNFTEWINELDQAKKSSPGNQQVYLDIAQAHAYNYALSHTTQDLDQAVAFYEQARRLRPLDERSSLYLAQLYRKAGRKHDALEAVERALQAYPTHPDINLLRGELLESLGYREKAIQSYRTALDYAERSSQRERRFSPQEIRDLLDRIDKLTPVQKETAPAAP